eukprot:2273837-Amphidinium_carterae.2
MFGFTTQRQVSRPARGRIWSREFALGDQRFRRCPDHQRVCCIWTCSRVWRSRGILLETVAAGKAVQVSKQCHGFGEAYC